MLTYLILIIAFMTTPPESGKDIEAGKGKETQNIPIIKRTEKSQVSLEKKIELCRRWGLKTKYCKCRKIQAPQYGGIRQNAVARFEKSFGRIKQIERRMKKSAWLPRISGEWSRFNDVDRELSSDSGPYSWDQAIGVRQSWKVKIEWEPGLLIFDPKEINLLNEKRRHALQLESTLERVRRNYFDWKYRLLMFMRHPSLRKHFELEELEQMLNLYTGNRFSTRLRCYE